MCECESVCVYLQYAVTCVFLFSVHSNVSACFFHAPFCEKFRTHLILDDSLFS